MKRAILYALMIGSLGYGEVHASLKQGQDYLIEKKIEAARRMFDQVVADRPEDEEGHWWRALVYCQAPYLNGQWPKERIEAWEREKTRLREDAFMKDVVVEPLKESVVQPIGKTVVEHRHFRRVRTEMKGVNQSMPEGEVVREALIGLQASAWVSPVEREQSLFMIGNELAQVIRVRPRHPGANLLLSWLFVKLGEPDMAARRCEVVLETKSLPTYGEIAAFVSEWIKVDIHGWTEDEVKGIQHRLEGAGCSKESGQRWIKHLQKMSKAGNTIPP